MSHSELEDHETDFADGHQTPASNEPETGLMALTVEAWIVELTLVLDSNLPFSAGSGEYSLFAIAPQVMG